MRREAKRRKGRRHRASAERCCCSRCCCPFAAPVCLGRSRVPKPVIEIDKPGKCVERHRDPCGANHMDMLKHQRDLTMHEGIRTTKHSLKECIECHASTKTGSVLGDDRASARAATVMRASSSIASNAMRPSRRRRLSAPAVKRHRAMSDRREMSEPEPPPDLPDAMSRRQFIAWGAARSRLAIAPGVTLIEIAHGAPARTAASEAGALGHADRHQQMRAGLQRLRHSLRHRERHQAHRTSAQPIRSGYAKSN